MKNNKRLLQQAVKVLCIYVDMNKVLSCGRWSCVWKAGVALLTHLLVVVVVGVDVVVELLVPHVLLVAQLAVKVGVSLLLQGGNTHGRQQMNKVGDLRNLKQVGKTTRTGSRCEGRLFDGGKQTLSVP